MNGNITLKLRFECLLTIDNFFNSKNLSLTSPMKNFYLFTPFVQKYKAALQITAREPMYVGVGLIVKFCRRMKDNWNSDRTSNKLVECGCRL